MTNEPEFFSVRGLAVVREKESARNMTKRELIAAMAMQGHTIAQYGNSSAKTVAKDAVELADALIAELNKGPSDENSQD